MKGALVFVALACVMALALLLQQVEIEPDPDEVFTAMDEIQVRDAAPGGRMVNANTSYRRCEDSRGELSTKGTWVYYERDGWRRTLSQTCWR